MNLTDIPTVAMADLSPGDTVLDTAGRAWRVEYYNPPGHPANAPHPNGRISLVAADDATCTMLVFGTRLSVGWSVAP